MLHYNNLGLQFNKIFCIGLSRTGTTSLSKALIHLNFKCIHYANRKWIIYPEMIPKYRAFADTPISYRFEELDILYPRSKFIYTIRTIDKWIGSMVRFGKKLHRKGPYSTIYKEYKNPEQGVEAHSSLYGPLPHTANNLPQRYQEFDNRVRTYFRGRERDLLVLDICSGEGYERLCPFLGIRTIHHPFPWKNASH